MKHLLKSAVQTAILAPAFCTMSLAYAVEEVSEKASPHTLTANVGFFTDYTFRGISYTKERGSIQGGFDYTHNSGFYAGIWSTNVDNAALYGNTQEIDLYGGYVQPLTDDLSVNVGFMQYFYPHDKHAGEGTANRGRSANTTELNAALNYKNFTLKHSHAVNNFFGVNHNYGGNGHSRGSGYTELNFTSKLPFADLNLLLHVGRQTVRNYSQANYTDWLVGVNKDFSVAGSTGWNAGVNYTTTNADDNWYVDARGWETGNDRFIGFIKRTF